MQAICQSFFATNPASKQLFIGIVPLEAIDFLQPQIDASAAVIPTGLIEPDGSAVLLIDIQADGLQSRFPAHFCGMAEQCPSYARCRYAGSTARVCTTKAGASKGICQLACRQALSCSRRRITEPAICPSSSAM